MMNLTYRPLNEGTAAYSIEWNCLQTHTLTAPSRVSLWLLLAVLLFIGEAQANPDHSTAYYSYPGKHWEHLRTPERMGWSSDKLPKARQYSESIRSAAVVIVDHGVIVSEWGNVERKYNVHSIRKSFVSVLIGIAVAKRAINLDSTLEELGIDDNAPSF
jgi:CubicO group peptidase (beta-lactamase class C family)